MTIVTITGAARLARVSRGTIYNKVESGELSKGPDGIDTTELLRVFGTLHDVSNDAKTAKSDGVSGDREKLSGVMARQNDEFTTKLLEQLEDAKSEKEWLRDLAEKREKQALDAQDRLTATIERHADERQQWTERLNEIQKRLPAPEALMPRKKFLGIF